jgi:predicted permease
MISAVTTIRQTCARLLAFFRKQKLDREFDQELSTHLEFATQDFLRQGMAPAEARRLAFVKLGGVEHSKELQRDARGLAWLEGIIQDIRASLRTLRRTPGFALTAVAMLALGIGVNAAVFTVTNAVLFKGFPMVAENDRLLYISNGGCCISYPDFADIRAQAKSFSSMGITHGLAKVLTDSTGFAEHIEVTEVSADTFRTVGRSPILGRDFTRVEEAPGAAPVAMLSYGFWERRYGKNPSIVGRAVRMNGTPTTVIGIMPQGFSFPQKVDVWVPLVQTAAVLNRNLTDTWFAFGRLAPSVTFASARAEVEGIIKRLETTYPMTDQRNHLVVQDFAGFFIGPNAAALYGSMWAAVGFVLLIACANLANLLLSRSLARAREISVRIALGAGRGRIIRQLLIESVMLSGAGGLLGWWIAGRALRIFQLAMARKASWLILDYTMDHRVLGYLVAVSFITGILFGLAPALRLSQLDLGAALKDGGRSATTGGRGRHLSRLLVMGEMALAIVLLAGAGVMIRSFLKIHNANMGVNTANTLVASLDLPSARYPTAEQKISFYDRLTERVASEPDVESVALAEALPSWNAHRIPYELADAPQPANADFRRPKVLALKIGPAYFQTLGASVLSGRDFDDSDQASATSVAIVNQLLASKFWPGENPLGKRFRLFDDPDAQEPWLTVVGIASNIIQNDQTRQRFEPLVYLPYRQNTRGGMWIFVRTHIQAGRLAPVLRQQAQILDPDLPMYGPFILMDRLEFYWDSQFYGILFLLFAGIALLLASVGLYTVVAHSVARRTQEIGIRVAIGATARDILRLVFTEGMLPLGIGLTIGLAASLAVNRAFISLLVNVSPADPLALAAASAVLVTSAVLGCLIPARRALRVDAVIALRHD